MRTWGRLLVILLFLFRGTASNGATPAAPPLRLATFTADVTAPIGHGMMGGLWLATSVADPLEAHGFVLLGGEAPVVFVSVDWCWVAPGSEPRMLAAIRQALQDDRFRIDLHAPYSLPASTGGVRSRRPCSLFALRR